MEAASKVRLIFSIQGPIAASSLRHGMTTETRGDSLSEALVLIPIALGSPLLQNRNASNGFLLPQGPPSRQGVQPIQQVTSTLVRAPLPAPNSIGCTRYCRRQAEDSRQPAVLDSDTFGTILPLRWAPCSQSR